MRGGLLVVLLVCACWSPSQVMAESTENRTEKSAGRTSRKVLEFATTDDSDFRKMGKPRGGDWLAVHHEPGQTFRQYVRSKPVRPDKRRSVLVFQPMGSFSADHKKLLAKATEFAGVFFRLKVRVEPEIPLPTDLKGTSRINRFTGKRQFLTGHLLKLLRRKLPPDAVACLGVTMEDLYPQESWNYVFGQASLRERVGVYSFIRYTPEFWNKGKTKESEVQLLRRSCKILTHESGHMFGLLHCISYECGMNGSNNLAESDRRPLMFCPVCLRKLQWNLSFDVVTRYEAMRKFFDTNGLKTEAKWIGGRLRKMGEVTGSHE